MPNRRITFLMFVVTWVVVGCTRVDLEELRHVCMTSGECHPNHVCAPGRGLCVPASQLTPEPFLESAELRAFLFLPDSTTRYWYEAQTIARPGVPMAHVGTVDDGLTVHAYDEGPVAIVPEGRGYRAYYADATTAVGDGYTFGERSAITLPLNKSMADVVGIARAPDNLVRTFFRDNTFVVSASTDLTGDAMPFVVAEAKTATAVAAMAFDSAGALHTICHDGTTMVGTASDLSTSTVAPGAIAGGFASKTNDAAILYKTGYIKVFDGRIPDNWSLPTRFAGDWRGAKPTKWEGYVDLAANPRDVVAIATVGKRSTTSTSGPCVADPFAGDMMVYYRGGVRSFGDGELRDDDTITGFDLAAGATSAGISTSDTWEEVIDVIVAQSDEALCDATNTVVWFTRGVRRLGSPDLLATKAETVNQTSYAGIRNIYTVVAIFNEIDGASGQWVLYRDGTFSRGWSQCHCGYCSTPTVACFSSSRCPYQRLNNNGLPYDCREGP